MPEFKEVFKETGVDLLNRYMAVGSRGSNLVALQNAKHLHFDPLKLDVIEVNRSNLSRVSNILEYQFSSWGVGKDDSKAYMAAVHSLLAFGIHSRLLLVTGKIISDPTLTATNGTARTALNVSVLPSLEFTVAFRFVELRDAAGNDLGTTMMAPSDARWLLEKLNWIYGLQANVSFELTDAEIAKVQLPDGDLANALKGGQALTGQAFLNYIVGQKSKKANFTIFFVHKYISKDKEGVAETFWHERACVVDDHPENAIVVPKGVDPYVVNLAHEVAHFLIDENAQAEVDSHHNRPNVLQSKGSQTTRLDQQMVELINS